MKCAVCKKEMAETFLKKIVGSYVKDSKGKLHAICHECQKQLGTKEAILSKL